MARVARRTSATVRASTPWADMSDDSRPRSAVAVGLYAGSRPWLGLMVVTPLHQAGTRSEPAMSLPWWIGPNPATVAAPAPPDEPPGEASGCHGLRVGPSMGLDVVKRIDSSGTLVRPTKMAPARRRLATTAESAGAMVPARAGRPFGVGWPSTSRFCLMVTGTPWSGPSGAPAARASSAATAAAMAASPRSTTMALTWGFTARMRSTTSAVTSAQVKSPRSYPSISSVAERFQRSMGPGW